MTPAMDSGRLVARLERLVAFDTQNPPGAREADCAAWLAAELAGMGFAVEVDSFDEGRANVVARLANGPGPCFAFNTHMDVVPAGEGWSTDPFRLVPRGADLVGRGACDAKGALAAMLEALQLLSEARGGWSGTLMGVLVADEEASSRGAKRYAATKPGIDLVVVGEPSGKRGASAPSCASPARRRIRGRPISA